MKNSLPLSASALVEAMVVLLIVVSGIVGVYGILDSSQKLSSSTEHRIEAIQIARDGLEAMTNIRDTNWILFGADKRNCWNVLNYNNTCVGNNTTTNDINLGASQGIRISQNANNQFFIGIQSPSGVKDITNSNYITAYRVMADANGFYTQVGGTPLVPTYTREIQVQYIDTNGGPVNSNDEKMKVTAIVQWLEPSDPNPKRLEMSTILSNWK